MASQTTVLSKLNGVHSRIREGKMVKYLGRQVLKPAQGTLWAAGWMEEHTLFPTI